MPIRPIAVARADRRSAALGTPEARYRCRPSASKINVVGSDSTENRRAAAGLASMSISTWATSPRASQTWSTTRRTRSQGPHHGALKCTTVGPVRDRPRSVVSGALAWAPSADSGSNYPDVAGAPGQQPADHGAPKPMPRQSRRDITRESCSFEPVQGHRYSLGDAFDDDVGATCAHGGRRDAEGKPSDRAAWRRTRAAPRPACRRERFGWRCRAR